MNDKFDWTIPRLLKGLEFNLGGALLEWAESDIDDRFRGLVVVVLILFFLVVFITLTVITYGLLILVPLVIIILMDCLAYIAWLKKRKEECCENERNLQKNQG